MPEDNVRSTISIFRPGRGAPQFPTLVSAAAGGAPIGWGALSALTADPRRPDRLWTVSDSYYSPTKLYADRHAAAVGADPRLITARPHRDRERRPARRRRRRPREPAGRWFLAGRRRSHRPGRTSSCCSTAQAAVQRRIPLPADVAAGLGSRGLEGVAVTGTGRLSRSTSPCRARSHRPTPGSPGSAATRSPPVPGPGTATGSTPAPPSACPSSSPSAATASRSSSGTTCPGPPPQVKRIYRSTSPTPPDPVRCRC